MTTPLDLTDRLVREMADRDHEPAEVWTVAGELLSVHCRTCGNGWPCPTRLALDALPPDPPPASLVVDPDLIYQPRRGT